MMGHKLNICDCFWDGDISGVRGYEVLKKRISDGKATCKAFEDYARLRAKAEEDYGKAIQLAVKKALTDIPETTSTLRRAMETLREESEKMATAHLDNSAQFMDSAQRMREFIERQKCERTVKEQALDKTIVEKGRQLRKNQEMKRLYDVKSEEADQAQSLYNRAKPQESQYPTKEWDKIIQKQRRTEDEANKAKINYTSTVDRLERLRLTWEKEMKAYCELVEGLEEARIKMLQNEIWLISNVISSACVYDDDYCETIRKNVERIDTDADIQAFIHHSMTGTERPAPVRFEQYKSTTSQPVVSSPFSNDNSSEQRYQPAPSRPPASAASAPNRPPPPANPQQLPIILTNRSYQH